MKSNIIYILTAAIFTIVNLEAQWQFNSAINREYSSNPFHSPDPVSSSVTIFDFALGRTNKSFDISYSGSYKNYSTLSGSDTYWQQAALYSDSDSISWGGMIENQINGINTDYLNYINGSAYFNILLEFSEIYWKIESDLNFMKYSKMRELDNINFSASLRGIKSFESKTTFILGTEVNYKNYLNALNSSGNEESSTILQISLNPRISQSIWENWGIAVFHNQRIVLNSPAVNAVQYESGYGDESLYFDDPFSNRGFKSGIVLTGKLPADITVKSGFNYSELTFVSQPVYISETTMNFDVLRRDIKQNYFISVDWEISVGENSTIDFITGYSFEKSTSNSYWFNYKNSSFSVGAQFYF